jgi:predicted N-formylglutamate amidohydrolase
MWENFDIMAMAIFFALDYGKMFVIRTSLRECLYHSFHQYIEAVVQNLQLTKVRSRTISSHIFANYHCSTIAQWHTLLLETLKHYIKKLRRNFHVFLY